jgi:hypothetical protein
MDYLVIIFEKVNWLKYKKTAPVTSVMIKITHPKYDYRLKKEQGKEWIFDPFRKRWIRLTPEEWVRQHFLQYLVQEKKYPDSLIAIEKEIQLGELKKRFDILVYKDAAPWMVIECKEMNVVIDDTTLRQVLNYNITLQAPFIVITNGNSTYGFGIQQGKVTELTQLPAF